MRPTGFRPRSRRRWRSYAGARRGGIIGAVTGPAFDQAIATLVATDPVLASLVESHGPPPRRRPVRASERFAALAEIIVFQQLAGKAAATIHGRLVIALGGEVTPASVLAARSRRAGRVRAEWGQGRFHP